MHPPRIPLDFDFSGSRIASGDTGTFWFGVLLVLIGAWNIRVELLRVFADEPDIEHKKPEVIGAVLGLHGAFVLVGIYLMVCGLIGARPFAFLFV